MFRVTITLCLTMKKLADYNQSVQNVRGIEIWIDNHNLSPYSDDRTFFLKDGASPACALDVFEILENIQDCTTN